MPGEDPEAALARAESFRQEGIRTLFTRLGENVARAEEARATADHYLRLLDDIAARQIPGEISVKLTQLGFDFDEELAFSLTGLLAERASRTGGVVWLDMEGSSYTERTIAFYERLKGQHVNAGLCLQAYLHRTASDLARLLPRDPVIRLVKGAYDEPAVLAYRSRREVDSNYVGLAVTMLNSKAAGLPIRIGLGTHDVALIEQLALHARALGLSAQAFEVQMLYGIRVDEQRRLASKGYLVSDLIAYGPAWYPWYMRRLAERPANVLFALRQIVG